LDLGAWFLTSKLADQKQKRSILRFINTKVKTHPINIDNTQIEY